MLLKKLKIKNIRSYKDAEVDFPEGSTLLMGDIGSGKTSILLSIEFALFGLQPSQRGSSLLRNNESEAFVSLEFEVDGQNVIIERKLKKGGKAISQEDVSISIGDEKIEGSVTEIKNKVLTLLNYPQDFAKKTNDLYKFTIYTPQEEMKQIILEPSEVRLNTLRHIFGVDKYKRISENIEKIGVKLRQEIRLKESQLKNVEEIKKELENKEFLLEKEKYKIKEIETEVEKIGQEKIKAQAELKELETKIDEKSHFNKEKEKSELMLSNKKESIQTYEREIAALKDQIKEGQKFSVKEEDIASLNSRISSQENIQRQLNEEHLAVSSRLQNYDEKVKEIEKLKNKISGLCKCPTCLQEVNEEYKKNIFLKADEELQKMNEQSAADKIRKVELRDKIEQSKKQIESFKNALSEIRILKVKLEGLKEKEKRVEDIEKTKIAASRDSVMLAEQIESFKKMILDLEKYSGKYEAKNREIQMINAEENKALIKKAELNKDIQFIEQQMKNIREEMKKSEELAKKIIYLKELEFWISNKFYQLVLHTEKNILVKLREEFLQLFSSWFSVLVSDELGVRLDETFSPIVQQQDYEIDYEFLSGGERTAVALAYRLALNQVINSLLSKIKTRDIVILDEPTDGFSETQLDKMRDVLHQLKVKQLILVSHEQKIEGFVDNIIRFKKTNGITEIEKRNAG